MYSLARHSRVLRFCVAFIDMCILASWVKWFFCFCRNHFKLPHFLHAISPRCEQMFRGQLFLAKNNILILANKVISKWTQSANFFLVAIEVCFVFIRLHCRSVSLWFDGFSHFFPLWLHFDSSIVFFVVVLALFEPNRGFALFFHLFSNSISVLLTLSIGFSVCHSLFWFVLHRPFFTSFVFVSFTSFWWRFS